MTEYLSQFIELADFIICKLHYSKTDHNRKYLAAPSPRQPPSAPRKHGAGLRRPAMLQVLWFPRLQGEFLTCKSEKALEKDISSNTGIKQFPYGVGQSGQDSTTP